MFNYALVRLLDVVFFFWKQSHVLLNLHRVLYIAPAASGPLAFGCHDVMADLLSGVG